MSRHRLSDGNDMLADRARIIGVKPFGASAPLKELQRKFGFEPDQVATVAKELPGKK